MNPKRTPLIAGNWKMNAGAADACDLAGRVARAASELSGVDVVVGLPPGSRHELGAFAFAVAARRAGLDVVYLGADVPLEAWRQTVRDAEPRATVIAVVRRDDARSATDVIRGLREEGAAVVAIGGPSAEAIPPDLGALRLPDAMDEAVPRLLEVIDVG